MSHCPTPHIEAKEGAFAKTVIMPGDPKRAQFIAKNFLTDSHLINDVRGIQGYTGKYKSIKVSVMASGMGIPSIGIYSYELYNFYGVENIIRAGSIGSLSDSVKVREIILAMGACTDSDFGRQYGLPGTFAPTASYSLLSLAKKTADEKNIVTHVGNVVSSDRFYNASDDANERWKSMGVLGVEMEAAGLYMTAAKAGKNALAVCTVSDCIFTGESLPASERETSFSEMMTLALETAYRAESL